MSLYCASSIRRLALAFFMALVWAAPPTRDAETRRQLDHGKALMEMLKQPLYQPKSDAEQVVLLTLASHGVLDEIPTAELRTKTSAFVRQFRADVSGTMDKITATGKLEPDEVDAILNAWKAYAGGDSHAVQ